MGFQAGRQGIFWPWAVLGKVGGETETAGEQQRLPALLLDGSWVPLVSRGVDSCLTTVMVNSPFPLLGKVTLPK